MDDTKIATSLTPGQGTSGPDCFGVFTNYKMYHSRSSKITSQVTLVMFLNNSVQFNNIQRTVCPPWRFEHSSSLTKLYKSWDFCSSYWKILCGRGAGRSRLEDASYILENYRRITFCQAKTISTPNPKLRFGRKIEGIVVPKVQALVEQKYLNNCLRFSWSKVSTFC